MKTHYAFIFIFLTVIIACTKKPEACISASESSVKLGQTITFTDCSKNGESYTLDFGDGTSDDNNTLTHAYESTGSFTAQFTSHNKNRSDKATVEIVVASVTESEIMGTWNHYKVETYDEEDLWGGAPTLPSLYNPNETYEFRTDTVTIDDGAWAYDYFWEINSGNEITTGSAIYYIIKLYDGEMVWLQNNPSDYKLHYFK